MEELTLHRLHFAFTVAYHYLFPQLTMGLALIIFILKTMALRGVPGTNEAVRFWAKILGVGFVMGVVTGIPLEFQFGTNWARFSHAAGAIVGQTLAMEGVFAFFLESAVLYFLLFGEHRIGQRGHWVASLLLLCGTWLSGYFVVCANAWMQHPVGYSLSPEGRFELESLFALLTNPWAGPQYLHTMIGAVITGCFAVAAVGSYYLLRGIHERVALRFTKVAVCLGLPATVAAAFPSGDWQAQMVLTHQPATFAAMEGHFHTEAGAGLVLIGQPNMEELRLDNPIIVPRMLSFLTHQRWDSTIAGLTSFPRDQWPTQVPLVYYAYHIMAGLGTLFIGIMVLAGLGLLRDRLARQRWLLWTLMLSLPFPFIANTAGWMTAECGRQPWIIHGLMRTADGSSTNVSAGNALFTLIGFAGMYALLSVLFFFTTTRIIALGPEPIGTAPHG
jgi:cytochrome d ubiquinol oxidase subunit I